MGRRMIEVDPESIWEMASDGLTQKDMARELGISTLTLSKRMAKIQAEQGLLLKYRELQSLQLTKIQAKILEAITPEKIEDAPLRDLVMAFKILKDKELAVDGKPSEIKGLVSYLVELEKQEMKSVGEGEVIDLESIVKEERGRKRRKRKMRVLRILTIRHAYSLTVCLACRLPRWAVGAPGQAVPHRCLVHLQKGS